MILNLVKINKMTKLKLFDELKNYKAKAEYYIRQHQDNIVIAKLRTNQPLTHLDVESLEGILWKEVGTKGDYEREYGQKPLGECG